MGKYQRTLFLPETTTYTLFSIISGENFYYSIILSDLQVHLVVMRKFPQIFIRKNFCLFYLVKLSFTGSYHSAMWHSLFLFFFFFEVDRVLATVNSSVFPNNVLYFARLFLAFYFPQAADMAVTFFHLWKIKSENFVKLCLYEYYYGQIGLEIYS